MRRWLCAAALVMTLGCASPCVPGETEACTCSTGSASARICRANGQFDPCACVHPVDAGIDGGLDAGADAGPDPACRGNNPPRVHFMNAIRAHLPVGGVEVELPTFEDLEGQPLTLSVQLFEGPDGGALGPPGVPEGGTVRVTLPASGEYGLEVRASDGCDELVLGVQVTGVGGRRLPFEVTAGACCDELQRPWLGATNPPRLVRLELDGGWETLAFLSRKPTSLSLSPDAGRLAVGQDSRVSFFQTGQPVPWVPEWTTPLSHEPSLIILGAHAAWSLGNSAAQGLNLDGGAPVSLDFHIGAINPTQGGLTGDGRYVVLNHPGQTLERLLVSGPQLLVPPFSNGPSTSSCGGLWRSSRSAHFFTGCGEVLEVADGGFVHAGTLPEGRGLVKGLGEDAQGNLVAAFSPNLATGDQSVAWLDGRTFALTASASRDLNGISLRTQTRLLPSFVFLDPGGAAHVLTVLEEPSSTWWETLK